MTQQTFEIYRLDTGEVINRVLAGSEQDIAVQDDCGVRAEAETFSRVTVSKEAEKRIEAGTQINGHQFKTDQDSVSRLREMLDGFGAGLPEASQVKACTAEGVLLVLDTEEKVQALYHAAIKYRAGIVTRSAEIQQLNPIPDPSQDALWDLSKTLPEALAELT
ncbi:hypothetical protein ACQU0X_28675 [Pseudovibrio ascidiaceicola]|uniref:hypothetical protein n=1 Tax=Pseudovibrio ascidiaceicola TaxID=285279 RepID=UPI003D35DA0F